MSFQSEADGAADCTRERNASDRGGRQAGVWNGSGTGILSGSTTRLVSRTAALELCSS